MCKNFLYFIITSPQKCIFFVFKLQIVCIVTPITGAIIGTVLVYAYAAIPGASGALYRFFSGNLHQRQEYGIVLVRMQLGDAKVGLRVQDRHAPQWGTAD